MTNENQYYIEIVDNDTFMWGDLVQADDETEARKIAEEKLIALQRCSIEQLRISLVEKD